MIVCSLPRCGATRFCLDLQDQTGLKFVGELHPAHIGNDRKARVHETHYQTAFSSDQFAELIHDHEDHIVLFNQHSYLKVDQADYIILRRNMKDAYLSLANFLITMYPSIKPSGIIQHLYLMRNDHLALKAYLDKYPRKVVWYEDYYGKSGTSTPLLDKYADAIVREIDSWDTRSIEDTHSL